MTDQSYGRNPTKTLFRYLRHGLTIRGLLAIVAVVALILGAVNLKRRSDLKSWQSLRCTSNLRINVRLGIEKYTREHSFYPPGTIPNRNIPLNKGLGWAFAIGPFLDGGEGFPASTSLAWDDPSLGHLRSSPWGNKCCPARDRSSPSATNLPANYIGIAGLGIDATALPTGHKRAGIFGDDRVVRPSDITDGSASTMMIAESSQPSGPWFAGGRNTVRGLDPSRQPYIGSNRQFGGLHYWGMYVLMADGSVQFVEDFIDPKILEAMSTMAGGEKVSVPRDN
jgi:hypothetical protein